MKNPSRKILVSKYGWLLLLLILVTVNFLSSNFHSRIDLTREKRYTLSKATRELVNGLDSDLHIQVFLKGEFPSGFRKLANSTGEFLQLLKDRNAARIHYEFISPQDEMPNANGKKYQDTLAALGASPINLTVQVKAGQEQKYVFPVALIKYRDEQRLVNLYSGSSRVISQVEMNNAEALLEYNFLRNIDEVIHPEKPIIAYAMGNGEPAGPETFDLQQTIRQRYNFYTFDLATHPSIPDQFNVFLVVKPSLQFTEDEKFKIDQYIMQGGHVLFFIDRLFAENDSFRVRHGSDMIAFDRNLNLTDFLFRYGVRINADLIMDLQCDFLLFNVGGSPENPQQEFLPWNYYPVFQSKNDHIINRNIGLIAGKFANSIDTIQGNDIKKTILLSSSADARRIATPALISLNENKVAPQDQNFRTADIPAAVLLEGKFTSFYRNRVPAIVIDSMNKAGSPFRETSSGNAKLVVVADGDIVLNEMITPQGQPPVPLPMGWNKDAYREYAEGTENARFFIPFANRNFLMNCLEYFTNKPGIVETGNKEIVLRLLNSTKVKDQRSTWQIVNIALPALLIILFGFIYQQSRKGKYAA